MENELTFREVDSGFYMGFIEYFEGSTETESARLVRNDVISQDRTCEERWCICDPNESYNEIISGMFDTYIALIKEPPDTIFMGSFNSLKQAKKHLNKLYSAGIKYETAIPAESIHHHYDYTEKKQSIFF